MQLTQTIAKAVSSTTVHRGEHCLYEHLLPRFWLTHRPRAYPPLHNRCNSMYQELSTSWYLCAITNPAAEGTPERQRLQQNAAARGKTISGYNQSEVRAFAHDLDLHGRDPYLRMGRIFRVCRQLSAVAVHMTCSASGTCTSSLELLEDPEWLNQQLPAGFQQS